jgi:hypothetical protein
MRMQANPSNATWLAGTCLGLVLAITMAISSTTARPAAADSKRGTGMRCESDSDCKSYDCDHGVCRGHGGDKVGTGGACESDSDCKSYDCDHGVCRGGVHVDVERVQRRRAPRGRVGLVPAEDRRSVALLQGVGIEEPAHAPQHPEVLIERPVLLHEDDDVLDVCDGSHDPGNVAARGSSYQLGPTRGPGCRFAVPPRSCKQTL